MKTITAISDPGHGWAKVKRSELVKLGIIGEISYYSYQRGEYVYLEEDCDLSKYIAALGYRPNFRQSVCRTRQSRVRGYERFCPRVDQSGVLS